LRVAALPGLPPGLGPKWHVPASLSAHSCGGSRGFGHLHDRTTVPYYLDGVPSQTEATQSL
jgi:hypothetical protein